MTTKMRDRLINGIIGITTGCSVVLFGGFLDKKKEASRDFTQDIEVLKETKLDKTTFKEYKAEHNNQHTLEETRITQHFDKRFDDFKQFMIELNKNK